MVALQEVEAPAGTPRAPGRSAALRTAIGAVAGIPPLSQLGYLAMRSRDEWTYVLTDDAYYYLGVARNIGSGRGSTFSGLTETNGYHPLWELVLSAIAWAVRDPYLLVAAVVVVQCLLWLLLVREGIKIGRAIGSEEASIVGIALLGLLSIVTGQLSFNGMESAPLLVLCLLAIRLIVSADDDPEADARVGIVFALVVLTRLDAALAVMPLAAVMAFRSDPPIGRVLKRAARLLTPTAVSVVAYAIVNIVLFDTATPVSGQAKSLGAPFWNTSPFDQFLQAGQMGDRRLWLGALSLGLALLAFLLRDRWIDATGRRLMKVIGALIVGQALLLVYLVVATSYQVWAWYFYGITLTLFCSGTALGAALVRWVGSRGALACVVVGVLFAVGQVPTVFFSGVNHTPEATAVAEFLSDELPHDAVVAMGDRAGLVGYLAQQPMLQTEGLMADAEWLDDLEHATAIDRMVAEGVAYYVWSGVVGGEIVERHGRVCRVLTEPRAGSGPKFDITVCVGDRVYSVGSGHDQFTVYRFDPEVNG